MKRILVLLMLLLGLGDVMAQNRECVLKISLSDDSPLTLTINGRRYEKHGRSLTIADLPPGRHRLQVYAYTPYERNSGGRANLVYSGSIRLERGTYNEAIVDGYRSRLRMTSQPLEDNVVTYDDNDRDNRDRDRDRRNDRYDRNRLSAQDVSDLKTRVDDRITDTDKLTLIKSVLNGRSYNSAQVGEMMRWLSFDSSKLDLAKAAYSGAVDKQDYWKLESELSFSSSKDELNEYISSSK